MHSKPADLTANARFEEMTKARFLKPRPKIRWLQTQVIFKQSMMVSRTILPDIRNHIDMTHRSRLFLPTQNSPKKTVKTQTMVTGRPDQIQHTQSQKILLTPTGTKVLVCLLHSRTSSSNLDPWANHSPNFRKIILYYPNFPLLLRQ